MFSPEVNDEVLVGFEHGSIDRPYVLGALYNGVDKPSAHDVENVDSANGRVQRRSFVSPAGHRVELLDTASGPAGVRMRSGSGALEVDLDDRGTSVVVRSDGTVVVDARGKVSISSRADVAIEAVGELSLTGRSVSVESQTTLGLKGSAAAELTSNGVLTVWGSLVKIN